MPKLEQFQTKVDWQLVKADWHAASLDGCTAKDFANTRGIPLDTFNKRLKRWRDEAKQHYANTLPARQAPGRMQPTGNRVGMGANASSPPSLQHSHIPSTGRPSTIEAQSLIEQAAAEAARALVEAISLRNAAGIKASLEVLDRAGVLKAERSTKASPYAELTDEQIAERLALLAPQVRGSAEAAGSARAAA